MLPRSDPAQLHAFHLPTGGSILPQMTGIDQRHSIAQLEPLARVVDIKPAILRSWKQRFGDKPPLWLGKTYSQCQLVDVAQRDSVPYPSLPNRILPKR